MNWGIISTADINRLVIPPAQESSKVDLVGVASRTQERADEYAALPQQERRIRRWTVQLRDPEVYAKGAIRHPDHATVHLGTWHRVAMNTEQSARAMRHVAFLD